MDIPAGMRAGARKLAQWEGWRKHAPAVGSVAFHIAAGGLVALSLSGTLEELPVPERPRPPPIVLDFVALDLTEPEPEVLPEPPQLRQRVVEEFVPEPLEAEPEPPPAEPEPPEPEPPTPEPPRVAPPPPLEPLSVTRPEPEILETRRELIEPPLPDAVRPEPPPPEPPRPAPQASVTPPPRIAPRPEPPRPSPPVVDPRKKDAPVAAPAAPAAPAQTPAPADDGGVYLPPSVLVEPGAGGPAGLRHLAYGDPCESRFGKKPKECVDNWRGRVGTMDSMMPRSKDDLKTHFAEHIAPCPHKVGCEGGEWVSNQDTRSVFGTPNHGGAASVGGINDVVGRLPQKPDFVDPGFGD